MPCWERGKHQACAVPALTIQLKTINEHQLTRIKRRGRPLKARAFNRRCYVKRGELPVAARGIPWRIISLFLELRDANGGSMVLRLSI